MYFNGTKCAALVFCCSLSLSLMAKDAKPAKGGSMHKPLCFIENKGQVLNQDNAPRNDIQYKLSTPGMNLYVGNAQLHYQFNKTEGTPSAPSANTSGYRMDVQLLGANPSAKVTADGQLGYCENYYLPQLGESAVTAHAWSKVTYKDVYPSIDWVVYVKNDQVEYDFVVRPGGNVADIRIAYDGATALGLNADGSLYANTPMGNVAEKTPLAFETGTHKAVASKFVLHDNVVSFETGSYKGSLTIDPYLSWSTYIGGGSEDEITGVAISGGNTYVGGFTASSGSIATSGSFQSANAGGAFDAFIAKYNNVGIIQFATYFGGAGSDQATSIAVDNTGANVYLAGNTSSLATGLITGGAYHTINEGGASDGFLIKFNTTTGARVWCTFYGGTGTDVINGVAVDGSNNVYITGQTASATLIASSLTVYQPSINGTNDAFLAKFNAGGTIQWSTYYGGTAQDNGMGITCDALGNVIFTGQTNSVINIATAGAFQTALSGVTDGFIAKFNSAGSRLWGTYIGSTGAEQVNAVATNPSNNDIVVGGNTTSTTGFSTTGSAQTTYGGGVQDAFIAYFNSAGTHAWTSYYGGTSLDYGQAVCFDPFGNVLLAGGTFSSTGIGTAGSYQPAIAGDYDAYVVKLTPLGQRIWGTYFGGTLYDYANGIKCDANNQITIAGYTTSTAGVATSGTSQTVYGGGVYDAFVTQFKTDTTVMLNTPFTDTLVCAGGTLVVPYTVYPAGVTFMPGNVFTVQLSNAVGSFGAPVNIGTATAISSGSVSCTIPALTATGTAYRIRIVASNPAFTSPDDYLNIHVVNSISASVATATTPTCVGQTIYLFDAAPYTIASYSWTGPSGFTSAAQNPTRASALIAYAGIYSVTTLHNGCPTMTSTVNVVVNSTIPPPPIPTASVGCAGSNINLFANPDTTALVTYGWAGPSGFTSTDQNPVVTSSTTANTGDYFVSDTLQGCPSLQTHVHVIVQPVIPTSVSITVSPYDTVCAGTMVSFAAAPVNGGVSPTYQWMIGASPVVGAISSTWASSTLATGDDVYCIMSSSVICPSPVNAISNNFPMEVVDNSPVVYIGATPGTHVSPGSSITFNSAVYNGGTGATYQWYVNGVAVHGATNSTYTIAAVNQVDTVSLTVASTMMCAVPGSGTSNTLIVSTTVGVANVTAALENIGLYPNPNNGTFTIKGDISGTAPISLEVTNIMGQIVYKDVATVSQGQITKNMALPAVADGIYFLRLVQGGGSKIMRFSVQR